ncbi:MAG: hypothetical protein ACLS5R_11315 [Blautia sp.]
MRVMGMIYRDGGASKESAKAQYWFEGHQEGGDLSDVTVAFCCDRYRGETG